MKNRVEKRKNLRHKLEATGCVKTLDPRNPVSLEGPTRDLSMKGVYVYTDFKLPVGTPCEIQLLLLNSTSNLTLWIRGEVIRADEEGMAFTFQKIHMDDLSFFKTFLDYNSGRHETITREFHMCRTADGFVWE